MHRMYYIIISYLLIVCTMIVLSSVRPQDKKRDYIAAALDLSLMLLVYCWDKERIIVFILWFAAIMSVYFALVYFEKLRPAKRHNENPVVLRDDKTSYLSLLYIIIPIAVKSPAVMYTLLAIYVISDRFLFYRKHKMLI